MARLKVFISSVQKELENERIAVAEIVSTDPFLSAHCEPFLYETEPASSDKALNGCLKGVDDSDIFVILIWNDYGKVEKGLSITHHEYRRAKKLGLPVLVFVKGSNEQRRHEDTREKLLKEIRADKYKYKRFANYRELQVEVRNAILKVLKEQHGIEPSSDENLIAEHTIEAASPFGAQRTLVPWNDLRRDLVRRLAAHAEGVAEPGLKSNRLKQCLLSRGLLWIDPDSGSEHSTSAAVVLLAKDPSVRFPQCRIMAEAYRGTQRVGQSDDFADICEPMPVAIGKAVDFVRRNTRHPMRVVGLNRVRLDEYPIEALREALVNAVAHRRYEMEGQKIFLTVFADRVVIASPGLPPKPVTIAKLRSGNYRPCSRNPLIAQNLSFFHRIDELGGGIARMKSEMLDHGLDPPKFGSNSGFLEVVLPGPADNLDRLRVRAEAVGQIIAPSVETKLNDRQREMVALLVQGESMTNRFCQERFGVSKVTTTKDLRMLVELGLAEKIGGGRSVRYVYLELKR